MQTLATEIWFNADIGHDNFDYGHDWDKILTITIVDVTWQWHKTG